MNNPCRPHIICLLLYYVAHWEYGAQVVLRNCDTIESMKNASGAAGVYALSSYCSHQLFGDSIKGSKQMDGLIDP
jgi:hypothetical protein